MLFSFLIILSTELVSLPLCFSLFLSELSFFCSSLLIFLVHKSSNYISSDVDGASFLSNSSPQIQCSLLFLLPLVSADVALLAIFVCLLCPVFTSPGEPITNTQTLIHCLPATLKYLSGFHRLSQVVLLSATIKKLKKQTDEVTEMLIISLLELCSKSDCYLRLLALYSN